MANSMMTDDMEQAIQALANAVTEAMKPPPLIRWRVNDEGETVIQGSTRIIAERLYLRGVRRLTDG